MDYDTLVVSLESIKAERGREEPVSNHQVQPGVRKEDEQADAGRDGGTSLPKPISQAQTRTREIFVVLCSAGHKQDWQLYPVDGQSCIV